MPCRKLLSRIAAVLASLCVVLCLAGCGKFFVPVNPTPPPSGTGNYFYVANGSATAAVAGFAIGTSNLTNTSNSPYALLSAPSALAVTPNGQYIYVATVGAIYGYSVGSNGGLNLLNGGSALITNVSPTALRVDPSGNWLIAADPAPEAFVFSINLSNGLLSQQGSQLDLDAGAPNHIVFTPNNGLVYIALGTGGVDICTFNQSTGALSKTNQMLRTRGNGFSDNGLAVDPAGKYLFVAETGGKGLRELSIAASGALTEVTGSPFQTGLGPAAVL
ncbi:MAG: beta-propeller fold lactonase family protein, partial [Acidobacteriaceae bacterium]